MERIKQLVKMKISDIVVDPDRIREDLGDIKGLMHSLQSHGQIQPLVVESSTNRLICGERRLTSMIKLGWEECEVITRDDVDPLEFRLLELEENIARKEFEWPEKIRAIAEIVDLQRKIHGTPKKGRPSKYTPEEKTGISDSEIASQLGMSPGLLARKLKLANALEQFPELANVEHETTAVKKYDRVMENAARKVLFKRGAIKVKKDLFCGRAEDLIKEVPTDSIDLVLYDPPFGINLHEGVVQQRTGSDTDYEFADTPEYAQALARELAPEFKRVMKPQSILFWFFAVQHYQWYYELLCKTFSVDYVKDIPLVWAKGRGATPWNGYNFSSSYEVIFYVNNGLRMLQSDEPNLVSIPRPQERIHVAERPLELYTWLIKTSVGEGCHILDPTFGSGASIRAALSLNCSITGFELSEANYTAALELLDTIDPEAVVETVSEDVEEEDEQ